MKAKIGKLSYIRDSLAQYGLIILLYIAHNTWFYSTNDMLFRIINLVVSLLVYIFYKRTHENNLIAISAFFLICAFIMELVFTGSGGLKTAFYNVLFVIEPIWIGIVAYKYNKDKFCNRFIKIVTVLSAISLLFFTMCIVNAQALINAGILKKIVMNRLTYTDYYCNLFYAFRSREVYRNVGMFSEPGLYQIVLTSAIYLLIFYPEKTNVKHRNWILTILIITLITTESGTGLIGLIIIIIGVLASKRNKIKKQIKLYIGSFMAIMLVFSVYDAIRNGADSIFYRAVFEKLVGINSVDATTGSVRLSTIKLMGNLFIHNPIGYGYTFVSNQRILYAPESVGARIFVSLAAVGIVPLFILLYHFVRRAYFNRVSTVQFVVLMLLYVNITLAQSREIYPIFVVLMMLDSEFSIRYKQGMIS